MATPQPDKLIALDLDGTLLDEADLTISPENLTAIERARAAGALVAIVTGRPYVSADAVTRALGVRAPIVAFNGAVIREAGGGEILYQKLMPADLAAEVVEECVARRLHLHYYLGDDMYVTRCSHWALLYCRRTGTRCLPGGDLRRWAGREPVKLLTVDQPDNISAELEEFSARWGDRLYVTRSMAEYLEFMNLEVSKGRALDWLVARYGIRPECTMAAGDRLNDLPLLEHAAYAVAMPEAEAALRERADFIPSNQPSGVAEAIDWFLERCPT
jgi:Cof subfamily protein (haloacid dehalogenase superfamily)